MRHRKKSKEKKQAERLRKLTYRNVVYCSIFEVEVAQYLDTCHLDWERNDKRFPVKMDNRQYYYLPDFVVHFEEGDIYIESKGIFHSQHKKRKTFLAVEQNNLNWVLIMLKEWKESKRILREKINKAKNEIQSVIP